MRMDFERLVKLYDDQVYLHYVNCKNYAEEQAEEKSDMCYGLYMTARSIFHALVEDYEGMDEVQSFLLIQRIEAACRKEHQDE